MGKQSIQMKSLGSGKYLHFNAKGVLHADGDESCYLLQRKDGEKYQFISPTDASHMVAMNKEGNPERDAVEEHSWFTLVQQGRQNVYSVRSPMADYFIGFDEHGNWCPCKDSDDSDFGKVEITPYSE